MYNQLFGCFSSFFLSHLVQKEAIDTDSLFGMLCVSLQLLKQGNIHILTGKQELNVFWTQKRCWWQALIIFICQPCSPVLNQHVMFSRVSGSPLGAATRTPSHKSYVSLQIMFKILFSQREVSLCLFTHPVSLSSFSTIPPMFKHPGCLRMLFHCSAPERGNESAARTYTLTL